MDTPNILNLGISIRKEILTLSLMIEGLTSGLLAILLGIKNIEESISFSNKSSALSFNQKISLLIDLGAIEDVNKTKLITFAEIRNQFMHNLEAISFEKCFSYLNGKEKWILKNYPQKKTETKERQLKDATFELSNEILKIIAAIKQPIVVKLGKEVEAEVYKKSEEALRYSIRIILPIFQTGN